jgi:hypothetical protein
VADRGYLFAFTKFAKMRKADKLLCSAH